MSFYERFPATYIRNDFYGNVGILAFDVLFLLFLTWDFWLFRRSLHSLTRLSTIFLFLGFTGRGAYLTWGLWHFHAKALSSQRIQTDVFVIFCNVVAILLLLADRALTRRRQEREEILTASKTPPHLV